MIRGYVERGDTIESLKAGQMGCTLGDFEGWGNIGGYVKDKRYNTDNMLIKLSDDRMFIFKLKEVIDNIKKATLF